MGKLMKDFGISYNDIISRTSIRRYADNAVDFSLLDEIRQLSENSPGLWSENQYQMEITEYDPGSNFCKALGGFGKIFSPPFVCLPYIRGKDHLLEDLGFRNEQVVLYLWSRGIGSCYIGCILRQKRVRELLDLPEDVVFASFIIFGHPHRDQSMHLYRKISQLVVRSKDRLSFDELFINDGWKHLLGKNQKLSRVIEAGRRSPSAQNIQPWRFSVDSGFLNVFTKLRKIGRIYDLRQQYAVSR